MAFGDSARPGDNEGAVVRLEADTGSFEAACFLAQV
jgi:hypothetical protein